MTTADVLAGRAKWGVDCADALEWLRALPDDSLDLLVTSPPYERCRTYGISKTLPAGQAWVDWMVQVVRAAAPKVKGLIAINCEGQTRQFAYSGVPFLLFADLHRAGFNMRKPCVFKRNGTFGGGGRASQHKDNGGSADWLRNDWEPVICISRPGKLPWADSLACGHAPKYGPGGAPSYRTPDGKRINGTKETLRAAGVLVGGRRSREQNGCRTYREYVPPDVSNPGNVIDCGSLGGGHMGHPSAHANEAPFPVELPAFFVKSFCPPGGKVGDCFSGSGTTCQAAVENGRDFIGCDVRQSQVDLTRRRMRTVTGPLFTEAT